MIMCLYIDNDNITKYNNNVQNPNHDAVIKSNNSRRRARQVVQLNLNFYSSTKT